MVFLSDDSSRRADAAPGHLGVTPQRIISTNDLNQNKMNNLAMDTNQSPKTDGRCKDDTSDLSCMLSKLSVGGRPPCNISSLPNILTNRSTTGGARRSRLVRNVKPVVRADSAGEDEVDDEDDAEGDDGTGANEELLERGPMMGGRMPQQKFHPYDPPKPTSPSSSSESSQSSSPGSSPHRDESFPQTIEYRSTSLSGSTCCIYPIERQTEGSSGSSSSSPTKGTDPLFKPSLHLAGGGLVPSAAVEASPPSAGIVVASFSPVPTAAISISQPVFALRAPVVSVTSPGSLSESFVTETLPSGSPFSVFREPAELSPSSRCSCPSPAATDDSGANSPYNCFQEQPSLGVDHNVAMRSPQPVPPEGPSHSLSIRQSVEADLRYVGQASLPTATRSAGVQLRATPSPSHEPAGNSSCEELAALVSIYLEDGIDEDVFNNIGDPCLEPVAAPSSAVRIKDFPLPVSQSPARVSILPVTQWIPVVAAQLSCNSPNTAQEPLLLSNVAKSPSCSTQSASASRTKLRPILPKPPTTSGCISPPYRGLEGGSAAVCYVGSVGAPCNATKSLGREKLLAHLDERKKLEALKRVNSKQIDICMTDEVGDTNLHISIARGDLELTYAIVEKLRLCKMSINITNNKGQTPLFVAVAMNNIILVRYLLDCDANPSAQCKDGSSPLHFVAMHGRDFLDVGIALCQAPNILINQRNSKGFTPLHCAVSHNNDEEFIPIVQMLLKYDANLDFEDSCSCKTALHMAVERGSLKLVKAVCESARNITTNINYRSRLGTALHSAAMLKHVGESEQLEIVEVLLKHGAIRSLRNDRDHKCPGQLVDAQRTRVKELLSRRR